MTNRDTAPRVARARLGSELRRVRRLAGLSTRQVANQVAIGQASVSRIENGRQVPSLPEVEAWADAVRATDEQRTTLTAMTEAALNEVESWRTRQRGGLTAMQADVGGLEAVARSMHGFQPALVPGLLQTAEYAHRVFALVDVANARDYTAAVQERMQRQQALYDTSRTFEFLITEGTLRRRIVPARVLAGQLDHIASVATLENVTVGIVPTDAPTAAIPWCGFDLHDQLDTDQPSYVMIELPHAGLTVSDPDDVAIYRQQLVALRETALFADEARAVLTRIAEELRSE